MKQQFLHSFLRMFILKGLFLLGCFVWASVIPSAFAQTRIDFTYKNAEGVESQGSFMLSAIIRQAGRTSRLSIVNKEVTINLKQFQDPSISFELSDFSVREKKPELRFSSLSTTLPALTLTESNIPFLNERNTVKVSYKIENKTVNGTFILSDLKLSINSGNAKKESQTPIFINGESTLKISYHVYAKPVEETPAQPSEQEQLKEKQKRMEEEQRRINDSLSAANAAQKNNAKAQIADKEEQDWQSTLKVNTIESFMQFLNQYPNSKYKAETQKRIDRFKTEEKEWKIVAASKDLKVVQKFLKKYPDGKYKALAQTQLETLKKEIGEKPTDEDAWKAVNAQSFEHLQDYLVNYPQAKHLQEALSALKAIPVKYNAPDSLRSEKGGIVYKIRFSQVWNGGASVSVSGGVLLNPTVLAQGNEVEVEVLMQAGETATVSFMDSLGRSTQEPVSLQYGQKAFSLAIESQENDGILVFKIEGGFPPYQVCFKQDGMVKYTFALANEPFTVELSAVGSGVYEIVALDRKKTYETQGIAYVKPESNTWLISIFVTLGILIAVGVTLVISQRRNRKNKITIGRRGSYS